MEMLISPSLSNLVLQCIKCTHSKVKISRVRGQGSEVKGQSKPERERIESQCLIDAALE